MDVFYEESSITKNTAKAATKYRVFNILSLVFLALGIAGILFGITFVPISALLFWGGICAWFFLMWFVLRKFKLRCNVNYDYSFVSGELRIAKVINVNKRRIVARVQAEEIIQIGDVDNTAFDGFRADPNVKTVYCTSNYESSEGKFFMYILTNSVGKKMYVLECREELLMHIMRFVKRTTLESDYVMQEKKQAR